MLGKKIKNLLLLFCMISLVSCTSLNGWVGSKLGFDTDLTLILKVDADINPDDKKKPSPLFIRLYELKATKMLRANDFLALYERDSEVLGADLIAKQELKRIIPGKEREDSFVLNKETQYVALFAEFLDYKTSKYKIIAPIVASNVIATTITVRISGNKIILLDQTDTDVHDEK